MALWGIELKPGNPITLSFVDNTLLRPKLLVTQATLGMGESTDKSVVKCTLGDRSPFVFATLVPNKKETAYLELEIGKGRVGFAVIGPRSVYLSGYHFIPSKCLDCHSGPDHFYYYPHDDANEDYYYDDDDDHDHDHDDDDYDYDDDDHDDEDEDDDDDDGDFDDGLINFPGMKYGITEENWDDWICSKAGKKAVADLPSSFDEKVTFKENIEEMLY